MAFDKLQEAQGIHLADFLREQHESPFEYIHGERIAWMPTLAGHTAIMHAILDLLKAYLLVHAIGIAYMEATIIEAYKKDWVKGSFTPDLLFFAAEKFQTYIETTPDWEEKPFILIPDLVIEVVSKNDSYSDINRKVMAYLDLGVKAIWIIDPHAKNAFVHSPKKTQMLGKEDTISGEAILPQFELSLNDLFSKEKA